MAVSENRVYPHIAVFDGEHDDNSLCFGALPIFRQTHTRWCPPNYKWVIIIIPLIIDISPINHSEVGFIHQLSVHDLGHHPVSAKYHYSPLRNCEDHPWRRMFFGARRGLPS